MSSSLDVARRIALAQAEDEGLWFRATTASEAYLQQELRALTRAVEGDPSAVAAIEDP